VLDYIIRMPENVDELEPASCHRDVCRGRLHEHTGCIRRRGLHATTVARCVSFLREIRDARIEALHTELSRRRRETRPRDAVCVAKLRAGRGVQKCKCNTNRLEQPTQSFTDTHYKHTLLATSTLRARHIVNLLAVRAPAAPPAAHSCDSRRWVEGRRCVDDTRHRCAGG
jgi:hypothetical protein